MERRRKRALRDLNAQAWRDGQNVFEVQASLDSNMKKNTAFIKRLRTGITAAGVNTFLQEIRSLSLHKYLTEIISACYEGLCRLKIAGDIAAGVEIVSALHQRFGPQEFTCYLGWLIGRGLSTPDKAQLKSLTSEVREREERDRLARQRVLLRVATELWLVGVLKSLEDVARPEEVGKVRETIKPTDARVRTNGVKPDAADPEPFPLEVLKDMLGHDREHVNLPLVMLFVKSFSWDVLGYKSRKQDTRQTVAEDGSTNAATESLEVGSASDDEQDTTDDIPLLEPQLQQRFKNILSRYFEDIKLHLIRDHKHIVAQGKRNAEAYVKSGEVFEDRQTNHERAVKAQEKLLANAQTLADVLELEMPNLAEKDNANGTGESSIGLVKTGEYLRGHAEGAGIWEDEDERRFYENLMDLKDRVPGILLEDGKKKKVDADEPVGKRVDDATDGKEKADNKPLDNEDQSIAIANKSVGAQVDALLLRLPDLSAKDQVDQFAMDFCFLNSKASRNRLLKAIEEVPKGRTDLLPLYSRLVATLGRYLTDIPQGMTSYLDEEFRSLQRRKSKDFLGQVRMVNVRYIAELTKFNVIPEHVIFHCLKVSLDDFSRMNIEIITTLLENCGRYLLRNPETSPRMVSFLETLQRKKGAQHLGQQERMLIENAVYYVNPPERAAILQKERTTLDLYVRKLVYLDLNKKSLEKIIKQIRKLHWEEPEVVEVLRRIFVKPGKIKFGNIHLLAVMLGAIYRFHMSFAISVMDDLFERIYDGLESNDFKYNQKRIAEVKYVGELYIYRMVDSALIFDILFKILNFGHEGYAQPGKICLLDLPDDYFRIRLVSSLLETCGNYFEKGPTKKKLDFFLTFLQYYINTKDPLPMDMEFVVQDLYGLLRPQWKLILNDLTASSKLFSDLCRDNYQNATTTSVNEVDDLDEQDVELDGSDDGGEEGDDAADEIANGEDQSQSGESHDTADNELQSDIESSEDEHIVVTRNNEYHDPEADADFDRELAKLMADSVESRKFERKQFDVPLPMRRTIRDATSGNAEIVAAEPGDRAATMNGTANGGMMKFALLSKKGNRQQTRSIDLPSDSNFAVAMRSQQQAEREEQLKIKNLVLNYDLSDEPGDGEYSSFLHQFCPRARRTRLLGTGNLNRKPHRPDLPMRHVTR